MAQDSSYKVQINRNFIDVIHTLLLSSSRCFYACVRIINLIFLCRVLFLFFFNSHHPGDKRSCIVLSRHCDGGGGGGDGDGGDGVVSARVILCV